jgi:opacity protein-like surface antigen
MRRLILVLTVSAMMLVAVAMPAVANHEYGDEEDRPDNPKCDWYGPFSEGPGHAWWEYWCYWPHWGWEFVFWVWAD